MEIFTLAVRNKASYTFASTPPPLLIMSPAAGQRCHEKRQQPAANASSGSRFNASTKLEIPQHSVLNAREDSAGRCNAQSLHMRHITTRTGLAVCVCAQPCAATAALRKKARTNLPRWLQGSQAQDTKFLRLRPFCRRVLEAADCAPAIFCAFVRTATPKFARLGC